MSTNQKELLEKHEEWQDTIEVKPKIKTNIKMRVTPEQSEKVQKICFENNIKWESSENEVKAGYDLQYLFVEKSITHYVATPILEGEEYKIRAERFFNKKNLEEIDADLFIRTNGTCIEKEEFTYPMWFKSKTTGDIVEFMGLKKGKYVFINENFNHYSYPTIGEIKDNFIKHTDIENWEQVEEPKEIKENHNEHYKKQKIDTVARCKANMTLEQQKAICIFNCDRYLHREKGQNLSDIKKIRDYLDWLEEIENKLKEEK